MCRRTPTAPQLLSATLPEESTNFWGNFNYATENQRVRNQPTRPAEPHGTPPADPRTALHEESSPTIRAGRAALFQAPSSRSSTPRRQHRLPLTRHPPSPHHRSPRTARRTTAGPIGPPLDGLHLRRIHKTSDQDAEPIKKIEPRADRRPGHRYSRKTTQQDSLRISPDQSSSERISRRSLYIKRRHPFLRVSVNCAPHVCTLHQQVETITPPEGNQPIDRCAT